MSEQLDLVVLGGGTGGYVAAIRAAQLGMNVAVVEKGKVGGTCLHAGCIPSKALLRSAEVFVQTKESDAFGILASQISLDFAKVQARKESIVNQLHQGVEYLLKKGKIRVIQGTGRIMGPSIFSPRAGAINVEYEDGETEILQPNHVIIATGSHPKTLPGLHIDGKRVMTSDEALVMEELPRSIIIVGGGVIGIEWASMLHDFGVDVTILEYAPRILPLEDEEISKEMTRLFKKRKIKIITSAKVLPDTLELSELGVTIQAEHQGETKSFSAERMLVSVGRGANAEGIGLESTNIKVERGAIQVNEDYQTAEPHIYAIGDCIGGLQLAHVASHEGIHAVEHMAGLQPEPLQYEQIARCTYSRPDVASVGITEQEAKERGYEVKVGKMPFKGIGKALVQGEADGFVKIIADAKSNDILGVHMVGPHVTNLISEAALAQFLNATPWEIGSMVHPHPTLSEVMGEAALAVDGNAIHI